jgi:hypothetical protein
LDHVPTLKANASDASLSCGALHEKPETAIGNASAIAEG